MTVYAPGSQVKSADLNQWQTELYGVREIWVPACRALFLADAPPLDPSELFSQAGWASAWGSSAAGPTAYYSLFFGFDAMRVGDRLLSATIYGRAGGVGEGLEVAALQYIDSSGVATGFSTSKDSATPNGNVSIAWTVADTGLSPSGFLFQTGRAHQISVVVPPTSVAGEARVYGVKYTFDRPNPVP